MRASSREQTKKANLGNDRLVEKPDQQVESADMVDGIIDSLGGLIRSTYPKKTTQFISLIGNVTTRQAERILAREQRVSASILIRLLRSDAGSRVLWHIMQGNDSAWWEENRYGQQLAARMKRRTALEQELKDLDLSLKMGPS